MRGTRSGRLAISLLALCVLAAALFVVRRDSADRRPNIVLVLSDDQSFAHTPVGGGSRVSTPHFDRVAREGALFTHAFAASPSCTPSRSAILTGQDTWRLGPSANLRGALPAKIATYTALLEARGYFVGYEGKGWGPPQVSPNPAGPKFHGFEEFLEKRPSDRPFVYWFGSKWAHRPYDYEAAGQTNPRVREASPPPFLPDRPPVRADLVAYFLAIERFDRELGGILDLLEKRGELANTLVVVTSDNGFAFPRGKANLYDYGTRVPLALMWSDRVEPGHTVTGLVNLTALAPTFLQAAGVPVPDTMTGRSLLPALVSDGSAPPHPERDFVVTARERVGWSRAHGVGYPSRAIRTREFLYIRNFEPGRWPAGDPKSPPESSSHIRVYGDVAVSPTKIVMLGENPDSKLFELSFGKRPAEELYESARDPYQMHNLADEPGLAEVKHRLAQQLSGHLRSRRDPRALGEPANWDRYPLRGVDVRGRVGIMGAWRLPAGP